MRDTRNYDAIVVGAGVNGLVAAAYLAKAGLRVLVAEARNKLGGHCETAAIADGFNAPISAHTLYAFDPELLEELKLGKQGLVFAVRDMPLIVPDAGTAPIVLGRDMRAAARSIAPYSQADAKAYPEYRQQLFSLARRMRTIWWNDGKLDLRANDSRVLEKLRQWSVFAWLDSWFETNALKAALAFDAMAGSPLEPGSALALLWRASQEMCGLQGAAALPRGGPGALVQAIAAAAQNAGVEIRTGVPVTRIHIQGDIVCGVELARGDMISAPIVISSLPARRTILELADGANLDIAARRRFDRRFGETAAAKVLFAVNGLPPRLATLASGRIVVAEGMEGLVVAHGQARAGDLPDDLAMELIIPTFADPTLAPPGQHIVSVLVRPVPLAAAGWSELKGLLVERTVLAIERVAPGFAKYISAFKLVTPEDMEAVYGAGACAAVSADRMLLPWKARVGTGTKGLYLCGASVEPMDAVSGRAGRITASMILMNRKS